MNGTVGTHDVPGGRGSVTHAYGPPEQSRYVHGSPAAACDALGVLDALDPMDEDAVGVTVAVADEDSVVLGVGVADPVVLAV